VSASLRLVQTGPVLIPALVAVVMTGLSPFFLTERNVTNLGFQTSIVAVLALGQLLVILNARDRPVGRRGGGARRRGRRDRRGRRRRRVDELARRAGAAGHGRVRRGGRARQRHGAPRWAIVLLGTNDARRHGRDGEPMLVSHAETRRNLEAIAANLRRACDRVVWVTPPPVADPVLLEPDLLWRRCDVAAKADVVRALDPAAVDLWPRWTAEHQSADGLHPSPSGQHFIAERLVWATRERRARDAGRSRRDARDG
jgi:lysophospholipase L1-like esterase